MTAYVAALLCPRGNGGQAFWFLLLQPVLRSAVGWDRASQVCRGRETGQAGRGKERRRKDQADRERRGVRRGRERIRLAERVCESERVRESERE